VFQYDGERAHWVAWHGLDERSVELMHTAYPSPPRRTSAAGRPILDRTVVAVPDVSHVFRPALR